MNTRKVNLFLVGAMKAGTTALVDVMSQLDKVYVPPIKEPHYFVDDLPKTLYEPSRFFDLGHYLEREFPKPLHITKIETGSQYERAYSLAGNQSLLLDASTAYLHGEASADSIHQYNPEAKIVIVLRDPLKRAFSHYRMNVGKGRTLKSFDQVMQEDIENYENGTLRWHSCLGMSLYTKHVEKYKSLFNDVCVLNFELLIANDSKELKRLFGFLGYTDNPNVLFASKNESRSGKFPKLFFFLKKMGVKDLFSKVFGSNIKQWIFRRTSTSERVEMELSQEVRVKVQEIFNKESSL